MAESVSYFFGKPIESQDYGWIYDIPGFGELIAYTIGGRTVVPADRWSYYTGEKMAEVKQWSAADTEDDPSLIGTGAVKFDKGKPSVWQGVINYFPRALWGVAEISTFGANKYAWNGWQDVVNGYARYQDGKFRHALLHAMGEELDADSKELHLKHEAWGALAALELYLRERENND